MVISKIFGWIMLLVGILIIGLTLNSSYEIFTSKAQVPEIFKTSTEGTSQSEEELNLFDIEEQLNKVIGEQLKGVIPINSITKLFNLISWSILAFILIFGGSQIAVLGIKLINK